MLMGLWLNAQTPCSNLVTNGNFEATTPGFTSALAVNAGCVINTYNVTTNFNLKCPNYPSRTDHTTGAGKFLVVQNSTAVNVWQNIVTVTPNTPYTFSFWVANGVTNAMTYAMMVDGVNVKQISVTQATPTWEKYTFSGFCPAGVTSLSIAIKQITFGEAYVYGIDDVSFISCSDPPCIGCMGSVASANLISNGSFTNGDIGFTTGLTYDNNIGGGAGCGAGRYGVYTNFTSFCTNWPSLLDHTNNSPAASRKYMTIDGFDFLGFLPLWQSPVNLTANTDYCFSFWWASVYPTSTQSFNVSIDIVNANGTVVTTSLGTETISQSPQGSWVQKTINWNSGSLTGLQYVAIRQTTLGGFRDWGIDDICFTKKSPPPCDAAFTFQNIDNCGNVQFTNTSTPTTGLTYCWDFDNNLATCESTAQNPLFQFPTCGTYNVCLIIAGPTCRDTICHTVTITDNIAPIARCKPGVGVILNANCQYNVTSAFVDNGSTDNCQIKSLAVNPSVLIGCGNKTVTLTVTDWCNNVSTCTMGIQTTESVPPVIVCPPNISVTCTRDTTPSVTGIATATDNCLGTITFTRSDVITGTLPCNATIRRTWTARDTCGNVSSCVQSITVNDNVPPTIVCPQSYSVNTNVGFCYYTGMLTQPTATDNCGQIPTIICSLITPTSSTLITPQTQFPKGINTISCIARDACGNTSTPCTFTLTVIDNEKPTIICPLSISVVGAITPPSTLCKAIVTNIAPIVTDNCPMSSVNFTITGTTTASGSADASGTMFMQGVSTVTYIVTDMAGNKDSCKFTIDVKCEPPPIAKAAACGWSVATCWSPSAAGPVAVLYDTRLNMTAPVGGDWGTAATPVPSTHPVGWTRSNIGNVFGIALDNTSGNIYLAATDVYRYDNAFLSSAVGTLGGGTAGVYLTNFNTLGTTTAIVNTITAPLTVSISGNSLPNTGGIGNGIGNIAYDRTNNHNQMFLTNLEDGRIYRVSPTGTLLSAYDPFGLDVWSPGLATAQERIWGIGVNVEAGVTKVYFAREGSTPGNKQIWSIALTPVGEFDAIASPSPTGLYTGGTILQTKQEITTVIPGSQLKLTDIAFTQNGQRMLIAERGAPHTSSVFEYERIGLVWTYLRKYFVGHSSGDNSAGGVDYGYKERNGIATAECDALAWATGNCMEAALVLPPTVGCEVYGMEGMSATTGNAAWNSNASTDLFIDFDGDYVNQQKQQIGDVEFFKCGCPEAGTLCDSISVTSTPSPMATDSCCFIIKVNNQKPNYFTSVSLCTQAGVSISTVSALNGWSLNSYTAAMVTVSPAGGAGAYMPVGNQDFIKFCLSNYQNIANQQVIVKYYGPNYEVVCTDTLIFHCTQKPKCLKIVNDTITCGENGQYKMTFCIMSDALIPWSAASFTLNPPAGVTFTPSVFAVSPALLPGQMRCTFTTTVSGPNATDGKQICFTVTAHKQGLPPVLDCCTDTVMKACVTLPTCICNKLSASAVPVQTPNGTCCWKINLINNYSTTYFTGVRLDILTLGVVFGSVNNPIGSGWFSTTSSTTADFTKINPGGTTIGATASLPEFCLSGIFNALQVPQVVVVSWLGPNGKTVCTDTLRFRCPFPVDIPCAGLVSPSVICNPETGAYTLQFQVLNNSGFTVNQVVLNLVTPSSGSIAPTLFTLSTPLLNGQTSPVLTTSIFGVTAGNQVCFNLTVHQLGANGEQLQCCTNPQRYCVTVPDCCKCGAFSSIFYRPSQGAPSVPKSCGDTLNVLCTPTFTPVLSGVYNCIGQCPTSGMKWEIRKIPNGPVLNMGSMSTTFSLQLLTSYFTTSGTYELTLIPRCGNDTCPPCKFTLNIQLCDTCQCRGFETMSFFNDTWPQPLSKTAKCDSSYTLPCTPIGSTFYFHGNFLCSSRACMPDSVSFSIAQGITKITSGTVVLNSFGSGGHFDIILNPALFTAGVPYTITVTGKCGNQICTCKVNFTFAPCGCLCETLVSDVKKGFKTLGTTIIGCKKTIMPMGLCPNDVVNWTVTSNNVITTTGNASITLTFTSSGVYYVCMNVSRFNPNGTLCGKSTYCQNITVICPLPFPSPDVTHCRKNGINGNAVKNGDFTEGALEGHLGFGGAVQNWTLFPNVGDGFIMVDKNTGASDGGHLMLNANNANRAGVFQQITLPISTFTVVEYYARNYSGTTLPAGTVLEFRLYNEPIAGSLSQLIYSDTIPKDSLAWMRRTFSPRVSPDQTKRFFNICLSNNGTTDKSTVGVDNIEICSSTTVDTKEFTVSGQFQIVPNPNQGTFTVVLSEPATLGMKLRILNSMGQIVQDFSTKLDNQEQTIQAHHLPNGMYFLQVVLDGKVVGVEKFVKQ